MLWIAIHLPQLSVEAMGFAPLPAGVVDGHQLIAVNAYARPLGVHAGMRKSTALALVPHLIVWDRDVSKEQALVESLAQALMRFTPRVALEPEVVLLEIAGSQRLFGGIRRLCAEVRRTITHCGLAGSIAVAPMAAAASMMARACRGRRRALGAQTVHVLLDRVPIRFLQCGTKHIETLLGLGCETLGQLRRLPRAGLKRRFGRAVLQEVDRAYGEEPDLRTCYTPAQTFRAELELVARADNVEALSQASNRLLQQLSGWLTCNCLATTSFRLLLRHEGGRHARPDSVLEIRLSEASHDPDHLMAVLQERLHRFELPAPVYHLVLEVNETQAFVGQSQSLLPDPVQSAGDFTRFLDRLRARLGDDVVYRLAVTADFRPERGTARVPVDTPARGAGIEAPGLARPTWLLDAPLRLMERDQQPFYQSELVLVAGPERIEYGWHDGSMVCRDYYVAQNEAHLLLWIYCERRKDSAAWFLHGLFG